MIYISEIFRKLKIMILALHITLMMDAANSEEIVHLMCVGSHHQRLCACSVIVLMKKMSEAKKLKPGPKCKLSDSARKRNKKAEQKLSKTE
jgi:hypothetical protein